MRGNAECSAEISARPAQETVGSPHYQTNDQRAENWAQQADAVGEDGREFGAAFDLLLLLLGRHLRRARTLLDLLAHKFAPIDPLIDAEADRQAENRQKNNRQHPTGFPDDVFKGVFRREENADDPAERTNRTNLRLRSRNGGCSHRGLLHHGVKSAFSSKDYARAPRNISGVWDCSAVRKMLSVFSNPF